MDHEITALIIPRSRVPCAIEFHRFSPRGSEYMSLLLDDHGADSNFLTCDEGSDLDLNKTAASELTVDREIKQRAISQAPLGRGRSGSPRSRAASVVS